MHDNIIILIVGIGKCMQTVYKLLQNSVRKAPTQRDEINIVVHNIIQELSAHIYSKHNFGVCACYYIFT